MPCARAAKANWLTRADDPTRQRLRHLPDGDHAVLPPATQATARRGCSGIPRLRMHADAPSRSALKLEAFMTLLNDENATSWCATTYRPPPRRRARQLDRVLVRNGMMVTSVDNGPLAQNLLDSAVEHLRADGFWRPSARSTGWSATWSSSRAASPAHGHVVPAELVPAGDLQPCCR
jgi:23S rRNA (cytidine2498-2'-O)-methyltransferase